jgi:hypothetical protein
MRGLNGLPNRPDQVLAQGVEVGLIPELCRERFQSLSGIVLSAVEAPIYKALDAPSQWGKEGCYDEREDDDGQLGLLLLADKTKSTLFEAYLELGWPTAPSPFNRRSRRGRASGSRGLMARIAEGQFLCNSL